MGEAAGATGPDFSGRDRTFRKSRPAERLRAASATTRSSGPARRRTVRDRRRAERLRRPRAATGLGSARPSVAPSTRLLRSAHRRGAPRAGPGAARPLDWSRSRATALSCARKPERRRIIGRPRRRRPAIVIVGGGRRRCSPRPTAPRLGLRGRPDHAQRRFVPPVRPPESLQGLSRRKGARDGCGCAATIGIRTTRSSSGSRPRSTRDRSPAAGRSARRSGDACPRPRCRRDRRRADRLPPGFEPQRVHAAQRWPTRARSASRRARARARSSSAPASSASRPPRRSASGVEVDVVVGEEVPLEHVFGAELGRELQGLHEKNGVRFHLSSVGRGFRRQAVTLDGGERSQPTSSSWASACGRERRSRKRRGRGRSRRHGRRISRDDRCRASSPRATSLLPGPLAGEPMRIEHWVVAERQGQAAAPTCWATARFDPRPSSGPA